MEIKRSKIDDVGNEVILTSLKNGPTWWGHFRNIVPFEAASLGGLLVSIGILYFLIKLGKQ